MHFTINLIPLFLAATLEADSCEKVWRQHEICSTPYIVTAFTACSSLHARDPTTLKNCDQACIATEMQNIHSAK